MFLKSVLSCSGSVGGWAPEVLGRVQGPEGLMLHRLWGRRVLPVLGRGLRVPGTTPCSALAWPRGDSGCFLLGAAAQPCSPFAPPCLCSSCLLVVFWCDPGASRSCLWFGASLPLAAPCPALSLLQSP